MSEKLIRKPNGEVIGRIRDLPDRVEARTPGGVLLGWYDKKMDHTRYAGGGVFCYGNAASSLL